ncbi:MAG: uracil phosphoribosyltransferase [bacterium]
MKSTMKDILITMLRDKTISRSMFRWTAERLTHILAGQAAAYVQTKNVAIQTPIAAAQGIVFSKKIVLVPILRSGITMLSPFLQYFPDAVVGVVGLKRDEKTKKANWYYENLPSIGADDQVVILDPMLATGGTAIETITLLKKNGVAEEHILFVGIVSAPEGIKAVKTKFSQVKLLIAAEDEKLNSNAYIVPGLGDYGDRYFGTE